MKINVSCSTKFHSFQLSEQLEKHRLLNRLFTVYHSSRDYFISKLNKRRDLEIIERNHIKTYPFLTPLFKFRSDSFANNELFDKLVSKNLGKCFDYDVFIGWSGMSVKSIKVAKEQGKIVVLERGSSHISNQVELLSDEYALYNKKFKIDNRVVQKEIQEYELADFITVPSLFARQSFIKREFKTDKMFVNNFGSSSFFEPVKAKNRKFIILYLGGLTIQKGLIHLFKALELLKWKQTDFEVWFIGKISEDIKELIPQYRRENWKFFGHINHYELPKMVSECSVMVQPSIQEGLSMVLPQAMSCGVPVIATTNTGGEDIVTDGFNGYIIPIRSPKAIADRLNILFEDNVLLKSMQENAIMFSKKIGTWDNYGDRYVAFLQKIVSEKG